MEIQLAEVYSTLARRFDTAMPDDIDDAVASAHVATWQAHESGAELRNPDSIPPIAGVLRGMRLL